MLRECFDRPGQCRRFVIGAGDSSAGPRLGGRAPTGVGPRSAGLTYLLTVPWDARSEVSVFVDTDPDFIYGEVDLPCGYPHFECVMHAPAQRGSSSPHDSALSEHPLRVQEFSNDTGECDDDGIARPVSGHKLGGAPSFVHGDVRLEGAVADLLRQGFAHAIQIDFPADSGADVSGPWPFGTGLFHVLLRAERGVLEWACFWEP